MLNLSDESHPRGFLELPQTGTTAQLSAASSSLHFALIRPQLEFHLVLHPTSLLFEDEAHKPGLP